MPLFRDQQTIAIGGSVENILTGSQFEILPSMGDVSVWHLGFGIIASVDSVFADVLSGLDVLMENGELNDANRWPIFPDDFDLEDLARVGERIKIRVRNDNAAAAIIQTVVRITPAG